jgi:hypothetical protein
LFSARNRTSKYSGRSCSFVAELLSLRKASALRFICVIRRKTPAALGWQRFDCRRVAAAFRFFKALSRASFKELRQFLPKGKAEAVMAVLSMANVADAEHALSAPLNNAEAIYRANLDMKGFHQEVCASFC